jgi:NTE family protein
LVQGGFEAADTGLVRPAINGVFAGGGIKGIALAGAAAGLLEAGFEFGHVVGTSSGALVAALIAAGYRAEELAAAVESIPWPRLVRRYPSTLIPGIGRGLSILLHRAQGRAGRLERIWSGLLRKKGVVTFADLSVPLRVVTTDLTLQRGVVLPDHLPEYGIAPATFPVAAAVRMSAAVPFYLPPVRLTDPRTRRVSEFVDGALTSNFPLLVARWSEVKTIVGFRFREHELDVPVPTRGPAALARAVITASIRAADALHAPERDGLIVIKVPVLRDPLDFGVDAATARRLFETGLEAAASVVGELAAVSP